MTNSANNKRIYLSSPHMSGYEQEFIQEAFATNWIAPLGPHVDAFERELADYVGARGAAATSSGTAAIHLALKLVGVEAGDYVFVPALLFLPAPTLFYTKRQRRYSSIRMKPLGICLPKLCSGRSMMPCNWANCPRLWLLFIYTGKAPIWVN